MIMVRDLFKSCPLCEHSQMQHYRDGDCSAHPLYDHNIPNKMRWLKCENCGHVFTDGYFSPATSAIIFSKTNLHQQPGQDFENQRFISARVVEKVSRFTTPGCWLDVGFGNASLLFTAMEWGYRPVGLDLRSSSVDALQRIGIEAHCEDLSAFETEHRFSVISMADVLEHMPHPIDALNAARRLLQKNGVLFLSMPNFNCAVWQLLDNLNANPYWGELEHYHNFSRERLYDLLRQMAFEPVHYGVSERYRVCMEVIAKLQ